ncbi:MAG: hypothetical protein RI897_2353 [Verrucomicrobiota bacterium]
MMRLGLGLKGVRGGAVETRLSAIREGRSSSSGGRSISGRSTGFSVGGVGWLVEGLKVVRGA